MLEIDNFCKRDSIMECKCYFSDACVLHFQSLLATEDWNDVLCSDERKFDVFYIFVLF